MTAVTTGHSATADGLDPSLDRALLDDIRAGEALNDARLSENTQDAYASSWQVYKAWCDRNHLPPYTPHPEQIAAFLGAETRAGRAIATLRMRLAAIRHHFREERHSCDLADAAIRGVLQRYRRQHPEKVKPQKVDALSIEPLAKVLAAIDTSETTGVRDRAMLLLGFAGLFRRSELAAIQLEEITWFDQGIEIRIPWSKTEQSGEGKLRRIPRGQSGFCPVDALGEWVRAAPIVEGPVFRGTERDGSLRPSAISDRQIANIVKARAAAAGVDVERMTLPDGRVRISRLRFSGHSLRRGMAATLDDLGASLTELMNAGDWKNPRTAAGYADGSQGFEGTPVGRALKGRGSSR